MLARSRSLALLAFLSACATLQRHDVDVAIVSGEWVDLGKTTPGDTMVWVLADGGDDELLRVSVAGGSVHTRRSHFGRWSTASGAGAGQAPALCFVRRPGRDAPSCVAFTLDTIWSDAHPLRRLTLANYVGEHHTGDRQLIERRPRAPVQPPPSAPTTTTAGEGAGGFQPRTVQPERPSVATHAGTVAPGYAELETGFERDRNSDGTTVGSVPTVLKIGLTRRTQLSLLLPLFGGVDMRSGLGDVAVGVKWRIIEDDPWLQDIAVLPEVKFASGGVRGTGTTDAGVILINSRTIGPVGVDLNVGVTRRSGDGSRAPRAATFWAAAAGIPVRGALGWALETFGYPGTAGPAGTGPVVAVLTGPTLVVWPELELDVGVILPVTGAGSHGLYAGFVTNLGRLRRRS